MRRGPKPKPSSLKILEGAQPCRINQSEPRPPATTPEPPHHLDELGLEAWERIVPKLASLGILTELDGEALSLYCHTYSRWRLALADIEGHGVTTSTDLGAIKANPAVSIASQCERLMAAILMEFGLTPSSRSRVKTDAQPQDALADFLRRRKG